MQQASEPEVFDGSFLQKLDRLAIVTRRRHAGHGKGERRSKHRGTSLEFVDYRQYTHGDDPRQVDWNAYGRSGNLFVKLYEDEEVLTTHLLLDVSRSMDWGEPNKLRFARRISAALGYIALSSMDRVAGALIGDGRETERFGPEWGRRHIPRVLSFFGGARPRGQTDLITAVTRYVESRPLSGSAILVSDLLSSTAEAAIKRLMANHMEVTVLHVVAPQEETPPSGEGLRLVDRETGHAVDVYLDQRAIALYQERLRSWYEVLRTFCARQGARYVRLGSATPPEQALFGFLQKGGVLR